mgnify:CR=1 FL=1
MNKRKKSRWGTFILLGFLAYFAYTMCIQQDILYTKQKELESLQSKIENVKRENEKLKKEKESIYSDEYYEKVAREKLGMVKPGEKVFFDINKICKSNYVLDLI